jgi:hypothetical protein
MCNDSGFLYLSYFKIKKMYLQNICFILKLKKLCYKISILF